MAMKKVSASTQAGEHTYLNFHIACLKRGLLIAKPVVDYGYDMIVHNLTTNDMWRVQVKKAGKKVVRDTFATFLRLWMQCGTRQGEMSALQNQDLDLLKGIAVVRRTWTRGRLGPTKTRHTRMVSFLHPVTEGTLEWRPGVTQESCRVLAEIRSLPVRSLEPEAFVFGVHAPWSHCSPGTPHPSTSNSRGAGGVRRSCFRSTPAGCPRGN